MVQVFQKIRLTTTNKRFKTTAQKFEVIHLSIASD